MKKKVVLIIQARMGSTRLPGKSMMFLGNKTIVGRILERVKQCKKLNDIVLAIPDSSENDILVQEANQEGIKIFRGNEQDCLDRYYRAALQFGAEIVGRLPADNPVPDAVEIDRVAEHHRNLSARGFSTNLAEALKSGYPDGLGAEMFDFALLKEVWEKNKEPEKREHVHLNFFDYKTGNPVDSKWCPITTPECPEYLRDTKLTLDINTPDDFDKFKKMFDHFGNHNPSTSDILNWFKVK
jgi:spore coat polysaccharide biosynthesis protein SpsF